MRDPRRLAESIVAEDELGPPFATEADKKSYAQQKRGQKRGARPPADAVVFDAYRAFAKAVGGTIDNPADDLVRHMSWYVVIVTVPKPVPDSKVKDALAQALHGKGLNPADFEADVDQRPSPSKHGMSLIHVEMRHQNDTDRWS